ncbi:HsdR family type I site-specific deoxyribonuclease [Desulfatiferula olefinivorans]
MTFPTEAQFEAAVIQQLSRYGWEPEVIQSPSEADLLANWATILFENNRGKDRLNDIPLTQGEMQQIMEQIAELRTPLKLNGFINGKTVSITRDNPADEQHFGKEVSLKIYDRQEIAAGQSRYQIVRQPRFARSSKLMHDRRGDLLLLINGMPVIHMELKKSGIPVSQACHQIEKYSREGIFSGLFALIQLFVAMEPKEAVYFANPGPDGRFNKDFYFHWADFNNEPVSDWKTVISTLLSIPMAHQLIGFYTVADDSDGTLKVMRSYQYYAAHAISDKVTRTDWKNPDRLGGYIWHTTGSGKTMTSFKSAQLIANSKDADKVVFLMDRIELGTQSLREYQGFAEENETVQATENTAVLVSKLTSTDPANTLIVTSIQKMSNIKDEDGGMNAHDLSRINAKRLVFIIDECHRSTFGDMLQAIKTNFPGAIFFGFSGTPIQDENKHKDNTTADVFGDELHRYSIADGIRDKNVLGFDPYKVMTYRDRDLRTAVALEKARAATVAEALADPKKKKVFNRYMNDVTMAGELNAAGKWVKGIEDHLPSSQYDRDEHRDKVVEDICDNWITLSQGYKFHAIFPTSSIPEAIAYYRLFKQECPTLKTTALFDPNEDNEGDSAFKTQGLVEILEDYNNAYGQHFDLAAHAKFKKDVSARLAHKTPYQRIETTSEKQLDLLIVVHQMLTGFDSKWVNTLYLDKVLKYENIIQAFSRTNRLFGPDKPFGTIRYYRKPHTMEKNIERAVELYSGNKPMGLFADRLESNLGRMNEVFDDIKGLFDAAGVEDFRKLPDDLTERGEFAKLFRVFNTILEAAKIQGFTWDTLTYPFEKDLKKSMVALHFTHDHYLTLALRYKELASGGDGDGGGGSSIPYEIDGHLTEIDTDKIDADYMNSRFEKYLKTLQNGDDAETINATLAELHRSFATLTQEEQKMADIFLHDIQRGDVTIDSARPFKEYVTEYQLKAKKREIDAVAHLFGLDKTKLSALMNTNITEANINEYGRFDELKATVDKAKAKAYFEALEGQNLQPVKVNIKTSNLLKDFIIQGGFEIELPAD